MNSVFCAFFIAFPGQLLAGVQEKLDVFVSIPPQKWLCEQLGQGHVEVKLLLAKGQEPHGFEPSPRQIKALSSASLFFTTGLVFEQEITRRLQSGTSNLQIIDTSKNVEKIPMDSYGHEHGHEHEHNATLDPHVWLSPPNLKSMAVIMAAALIEQDSDNEPFYKKNLWLLEALLDDLDESLKKELAPYEGASFFVFHPAFGYFAHRYHLQQIAVETGGKSPTPKQLFALIRKARERGVKVIFAQPQFDSRSAMSVAKGIGGKVVPLDPLAENVVENMGKMGVAIANALKSQEN
ncbi:zinc ABC transporter substrate-binding protein [Desulfotalea psychrophila]|uniref:Zinc ABC transporter substrate-binding protein n=1 Tax=Desulfotalea psychrophila TaxID=84980 RepID=A0ABS3ATT6_9BACT|nr:zinc ABC transporter substrate-binding protein [Desulfotalea psychrophila]